MPWANKDDRLEYHRRYYEANKGKWRERRARQSVEAKERAAQYMREYVLRTNYGLSAESFAALLDSQGGKCAICRTAKRTGRGRLHVDHCHATGKVRGLLCVKCNMALGWYEKFKEAAAGYLKNG